MMNSGSLIQRRVSARTTTTRSSSRQYNHNDSGHPSAISSRNGEHPSSVISGTIPISTTRPRGPLGGFRRRKSSRRLPFSWWSLRAGGSTMTPPSSSSSKTKGSSSSSSNNTTPIHTNNNNPNATEPSITSTTSTTTTTITTATAVPFFAYPQEQQQQEQQQYFSVPQQERSLSHLESQGSFGDPVLTTLKQPQLQQPEQPDHDDRLNYALLIALYTLQGIPMGLSASIPFLIQQKLQAIAASEAANKLSYKANAIFALCSWPFSLKLLWAPIVDACYWKRVGRRKSWLVPVQTAAGVLMVAGANFVERQLGLDSSTTTTTADHAAIVPHATTLNVKGVTAFFFGLYFLMATQDIAVDGWALTMLSKQNRGRGPICNSIGQNIGYFLSFVGFLALNDIESSEKLWRPLLRLPSDTTQGLVSLQSFIRFMGYFMLLTTTLVAFFKREEPTTTTSPVFKRSASSTLSNNAMPESSQVLLQADRLKSPQEQELDEEHELDASELGLKETYRRLWAVCQLPAVQWLFLILFTYRLPTAVSDNVKFLKAVEYGLSKSTTALLSPTVILPLGILVPIIATKVWHGHPLRQFMTAYHARVTLVPLLDAWMLTVLRSQQQSSHHHHHQTTGIRSFTFWTSVVASTAMQAICNSLQFNAQMTFFASRVDPAIGGSYMTLLNTAANLGGTYPASFVMWLVGALTNDDNRQHDPYFVLQLVFACLGILWIVFLGKRVDMIAHLPEDAWRTHLLDHDKVSDPYDPEGGGSGDGETEVVVVPSRLRPFAIWSASRGGGGAGDTENSTENNKNK